MSKINGPLGGNMSFAYPMNNKDIHREIQQSFEMAMLHEKIRSLLEKHNINQKFTVTVTLEPK